MADDSHGGRHQPAVAAALVLGLQACSPAPPATPPRPAPSQLAAVATAPPPAPSTSNAPPAPLEDDRYIIGAPRDETAFEYDVERSDEGAEQILDGVPPLSASRIRALQPFLETHRATLASLGGQGMLVLTRLGETTQVHRVEGPLAMRRQLTFGLEPVEQVAATASHLFFRADLGGDENYQIFRLDDGGPFPALLTDGRSRHGAFKVMPSGGLAFTGNARNGRDMDLYVRDPGGSQVRRAAELTGAWTLMAISPAGDEALMLEYMSATSSTLHRVDITTGRTRAAISAGSTRVVRAATYVASGRDLLIAAALDGDDHVGIYRVDDAGQPRPLLTDSPWDVEELAVARDGKTMVSVANEDGISGVWLWDLAQGSRQRLATIPRGVVRGIRFANKDKQLAFTFTSATKPADAYTFDLKRREGVQWTASEIGGLREADLVAPRLIHLRSSDGEEIPAFVFRPRGTGPFPVLLWMHGGPEEQFRPSFDPIIQYFAATRGVAVIAPNVRGSDGYGLRYLGLDDGMQRHLAVQDVGTVLDHVAAQPEFDADRVGIHGASYGGFMVLASLVAYPDRIRAGCDVVGISQLITFLENTSSYRQDLRRAEYGDERDPTVRAYLENLSPLTHAERIRSALLVAHGANDPRVPLSEATRIVTAVRRNGLPAWSFTARSEGHSFRKRRNRDVFYRVMAEFFERYLVQGEAIESPSPDERAAEPL